jgi:hypothetical protein
MDRNAPLARLVLRALFALSQQTTAPISLERLCAVVPAPAPAVLAMVRALDEEGFVDASRLRLTLMGFAAAHAPQVVTFERRRYPRLRKAYPVAC